MEQGFPRNRDSTTSRHVALRRVHTNLAAAVCLWGEQTRSPCMHACGARKLLQSQRSRRYRGDAHCCCSALTVPIARTRDIKLSRQATFFFPPLPQSLSLSFPSSLLRPRDYFSWDSNSSGWPCRASSWQQHICCSSHQLVVLGNRTLRPLLLGARLISHLPLLQVPETGHRPMSRRGVSLTN